MNQVPSKVMTTNYNSRIAKFVKYKEKDIESWSISDIDAAGTCKVTVHMYDGEQRVLDLTRFDLSKLLLAEGEQSIELSIATSSFGSLEDIQEDIIRASDIPTGEYDILSSLEFKHTLLFWLNKGIFVPPQEINVTHIGTQPTTNYGQYLVKAKDNSLGFTGEVKTVIQDTINDTPPDEVVQPEFYLSSLADDGVGGVWSMPRAMPAHIELDDVEQLQSIYDEVLENIRYNYSAVVQSDLKFDITHVTDGTDIKVTPVNTSKNAAIVGEVIIKVRAFKPYDLSSITNTGMPGEILVNYRHVSGHTPDFDNRCWNLINAINATHEHEINYQAGVYLSQLVVDSSRIERPDEFTEITYLIPPSHANEYSMIGEIKVTFRNNVGEPYRPWVNLSEVRRDMTRGATDNGDGTTTRKWLVPEDYDIATETQLLAKEIDAIVIQQAGIGYVEHYSASDYLQSNVIDNRMVLGVKLEARYVKAVGRITLDLVPTSGLTNEERTFEKTSLRDLDPVQKDGYARIFRYFNSKQDVDAVVKSGAFKQSFIDRLNALVGVSLTEDDFGWYYQEWNTEARITANWGLKPSRILDTINYKAAIVDTSSLAAINLIEQTFRGYETRAEYDKAILGVKNAIKAAIEETQDTYVDIDELVATYIDNETVSFKFIDNVVNTTSATRGTYLAGIEAYYTKDQLLNLEACTNNANPGEWVYTTSNGADIEARAKAIAQEVLGHIRDTYLRGLYIGFSTIEALYVDGTIIVTGGNTTGTLNIVLNVTT